MSISIVYIGIIRPLSHFDYINFKGSLVIKTINFNEIRKMAHLVMLVIFLWMWLFVKFSIYHTFIASLLKKFISWDEKVQINHMISNIMIQIMWNDMVQYTFNFHKN